MSDFPDDENEYPTQDGIPRHARVEDLKRYVAGGFHPVHVGDRLGPDERFEIHHKLGYSDACTVWLCLDRVDGCRVAVKIFQAEKSSTSHPEVTALRLFEGIPRQELRANHIFPIREHFWLEGPNGRHLCFVVEVLGPAISYSLEGIGLDTPDLITDFCFQAAKSLKYLHDKKICHGDFQPDHIRLQLDFDRMKDVEIYDIFGEVKIWHLKDSPGKGNGSRPKYLVEPASIVGAEARYRTGRIAIDDFSSSHLAGETRNASPRRQVLDANYTPPEIRFLKESSSAGFAGDIWCLASTIHLVRTTKLLLARLPSNSSLVSWLAWAHGPFPRAYWNAIGEFLANDSAVPVFTANTIAQKPPASSPRYLHGRAERKSAGGYSPDWGLNRDEVVALLLGGVETPWVMERRKAWRDDRTKYLRVKLPTNWSVWTKFQEQRGRVTGLKTLLSEDLGKERQWYECTDSDGDDGYQEESRVCPDVLGDAVRRRLNGAWDPLVAEGLSADPTPGSSAKGNNNKKRPLMASDTQAVEPNPKRAKTKLITERNLRDQVERVEQAFDGMTKFSYCLRAAEVELLSDLLGKMLKNDAKDRIGVDEVLKHGWFERCREMNV
ncbi:kinase-like domain-containing protein [Xylaria sp. CBS 124048]|nr:kinase-like domain-containing protein [Xylaria sp. CBS 124048]